MWIYRHLFIELAKNMKIKPKKMFCLCFPLNTMNEMCLFAKCGLLDTGLKPRCSYHGPQWARWCQRCSIYRIVLLLWCNAVTVYQIRAFVIHYIPWPSAWLQWKTTRCLFCQLQINDWRRYSWVTFFSFQVFSTMREKRPKINRPFYFRPIYLSILITV